MLPLTELPFVGGDPALDFVNTAEERGHPESGDVLLAPEDLVRWGRRAGVLGRGASARGAGARAELSRAREARELLYGLFLARAGGDPLGAAALGRLAQLAAEADAAGVLAEREDGTVEWRWSRTDLATVRHVAVTRGLALLAEAPGGRLKQCPGDGCGWFFLDTTKRGNRRWCSMADCGQDAKTLRRRAGRRSGRASGEG